jgi:outer membrane lipoprotein-sorting protein
MSARLASPGEPRRKRRLLVALALLIAVTVAGCGVLFGGENATSDLPSGEVAAEQYLSVDGFEATAHYEYSTREDRRAHIRIDPDDGRSYIEYIAPARFAGSVRAYNGSAVVEYNATENEYVRIDTANIRNFEDGAERIELAVDAAREEGTTTVERPPAGGAPLPKVPSGSTEDRASNRSFEVSYDGTETVAGREAHVISYEPVDDVDSGILSQTVWMDTESFFTLKSTQVARFDGERSTSTFRLSNVTVEPGFTASDFAFDPPPDATLNESDSYGVTGYDSRAAVAEVASLSVPTPDVPDSFSLSRAIRVVGADFTAVQLQYQTSNSRLFVTKTLEDGYANLTEGERVTIGSQTGRYRSTGTGTIITWQCEETTYTVTGGVQRATLLDVARSVECE